MVQQPPHLHPFGHLASLQSQLRADYLNLQQRQAEHRPSNPQRCSETAHPAFPARVSQPVVCNIQQIPTSSVHRHVNDSTISAPPGAANVGEHSLRRKTPNGTIDNGYDGTLTQLASGPPPFKHIVVPVSSKIFPTAVVQRQSGPASANAHPQGLGTSGWSYSPAAVTANVGHGVDSHNSMACPYAGPWGSGQTPNSQQNPATRKQNASLMIPIAQHNYLATPSLQPLLGPVFPQTPSPTAFCPGGYQQSPVWEDWTPYGHRLTLPFDQACFFPNAAVDSVFAPSQSIVRPGPIQGTVLGNVQPFRVHLSNLAPDDNFPRYGHQQLLMSAPHQKLEALSLASGHQGMHKVATCDGSTNARFKERALAQAHRAYTELLLHLSHTRKPQQGKWGSGSRPAAKMIVFPRPPTQLSSALNQVRPRPRHAVTDHAAIRTQSSAQKPPSPARASTFSGLPSGARLTGHPVLPNQQPDNHPSVLAEVFANPVSLGGQRPLPYHMNSPLLKARESLEMLSNLCEHSGWKWTDGMLLGGCLHYGLEHYEEALEWFKRITSLDESHVEAISNIAATLYCLNRQEEAEQHWMQAVQLRPSYLEAVEHLVSLLCSTQRSQEAVNTITFVQQALSIARYRAAPDHDNETTSISDQSSMCSGEDQSNDALALDADTDSPEISFSKLENGEQPGFGSSGYAIPGSENGRMLLLIHAKGNMLYGLKDTNGASQAFEEAVLISAGRNLRGVQSLIRRIQVVLAPSDSQGMPSRSQRPTLTTPLLLLPEKAKHTAQLVFSSSNGQLPGLQYIPDGAHKRAAISTTSNSLLSLAKIFQDAMSSGGSSPALLRQPAGVSDILALYYLSLSLQESPSTANNVGILLASIQQSASPQVSTTDTALCPNIPGIVPGSGLALALAYYYYGLSLDPKHVHLHTNLGSLLKDIGQLDSAIHMYEKAVQCDGNFDIALTNLANAVKDRGRINDAIMYYKRAVHSNPDFAEAVCGLSTALNSVCDWRDRGGVVLYNGKYDRWHVDATGMLTDVRCHGQSSGLMKRVVSIVRKQLKEASTWGCGTLQGDTLLQLVSQLSHGSFGTADDAMGELSARLRRWAGRPWEGSRVLRLIERSSRAMMRQWYIDRYIRKSELPAGYPRVRLPATLPVPSAPTVLPFHTFTCPLSAKDIRMISQRNALRITCSTLRSPWLPASVYQPPSPPSPNLNVGYVSSDFNNHPLAHLMQSVFGFHDPKRVKAFCYATTASDKSVHRQQIEREAPVFRDVSTWTSDRLINQIIADGIHILVNLNGYTRGARNEIFAARPAPIQMSAMGFAGTLGAEWCDYLLADTTSIPPSTLRPHRINLAIDDVFEDEEACDAEEWVYSENIIFSRDTFFCCDHAQSADGSDERGMTWEEEQRRRWKMRKDLFPNLPDDRIIMGNFNQLYKIDPTTFRSWLRILAAVPNTVLWLLRFPELGETNLKRTAKQWAGEEVASRIIFTDVAQKQHHISRARVCDLFLDTPECNAHTTSADVLWSSTPLLTLPRYKYKMCSRMAASILKGALPKGPEGEQAAKDLIASDEAEYENSAINLVSNLTYQITKGYGEGSGRLADLRYLLWKNKWTCALFDTRRWVRDLEDAYEEAWRRWVAGEGGDIYL
ncbi:hypothetical protein VTK73DRAFT_530 [Phialemonium thermophilum]|uniref:protein O-GlcNAc transferase n=1 Tax=Phialemonium thermophilum TaxID=223376 RepID=A0ABR3Y4M4_9PEZI